MSSYRPIPSVDSSTFHKLASVTYNSDVGLIVFWDEETRRVFYQVRSEDFRANGSYLQQSCVSTCDAADEDDCHPYDEHGEPIYDEPIQEWWVSSDTNILESIAYFCRKSRHTIFFSDLFLFTKPSHGKAADNELQVNIYDCDWSDFACDKLYLEFGVVFEGIFWNNFRRAAFALANQGRPYEDVDRYETELRKEASHASKTCYCAVSKPEKTASTTCDAVYVGDICVDCGYTLQPEDHERAILYWTQTSSAYRGKTCARGCDPIIEEDAEGKIRCEECWDPVRRMCVCTKPSLRRSDTVHDGRYASPTCGSCYHEVPDDMLAEYEKSVRKFVNATNGRL